MTPLIIALDFPTAKLALDFAQNIEPHQCRLKVGLELYLAGGNKLLEQLQALGFELFLDLKFHDIPNTVASACQQAAQLGVCMLTVHALGGTAMLSAAREAIDKSNANCRLIGVTLLTHHDDQVLEQLGLRDQNPAQQVLRLAKLAQTSGCDGVVSSGHEVAELKTKYPDLLCVTPGIRPAWSEGGDQRRIMTPTQALSLGADFLVIGRPITRAPDPLQALAKVRAELDQII